MYDSLKLVTLSPRLDFGFVPYLIVMELCLLLIASKRMQTVVLTFPECSNPDDNDEEDDGFWCDYNEKCIPSSFVCDGDNDCEDWEDETSDCANGKKSQIQKLVQGRKKHESVTLSSTLILKGSWTAVPHSS